MDRSSDGKEGSTQQEEQDEQEDWRGRPHQARSTLVVHGCRELLCGGVSVTLKGERYAEEEGTDWLETNCCTNVELFP